MYSKFALMPTERGVVPYEKEVVDVDTDELTAINIFGDLQWVSIV